MKNQPVLTKIPLYDSFSKLPLTVKMLLLTLLIGLGSWIILDSVQNDVIRQLFFNQLKKELQTRAQENFFFFDHHLRTHQQSVKIIVSQQRFQTYISSAAWLNPQQDELKIKHHYRLPRWLPPAGVMQVFFIARFALLIDDQGRVREVYHHFPEDLPPSLLTAQSLLQKLSHNQTYMTLVDELPYILTAQPVENADEQTIATLLLASPLDEQFLKAVTGDFVQSETITALTTKNQTHVIASSDLTALPLGVLTDTVKSNYLIMGNSFLDYGESEIEAGFTSFITTDKAHYLTNQMLQKLHEQRAILAAVLIGVFILLVSWTTRRIKHLTRQITKFSKESLGVQTYRLNPIHDEIDVIVFSFQQLRDSIRNTINLANAIASGNYQPTQSTLYSEQDQLGRALHDMNETLQNQAVSLQRQQQELRQINEELEQRVTKRTIQLAKANQEIEALNQRLQAENLRMAAELDVAQKLQEMVLPRQRELNQFDGLDITGFMKPADEIGGDYYDILQYEDRLKIGIGDVTGHGLESGVLMLMVQTAVRTLLACNVTEPKTFLNTLNRALYDNIQRMNSEKNLTLSLLDYQQGKVHLTGQHEEVLVVRHTGVIERIDTIDLGFMVGLKADISAFVASLEITLQAGDGIVLYTDGITEAQNQAGSEYGIERLCEVVSRYWQLPAVAIQEKVITDLHQHIGLEKVRDDLTLVILKQLSIVRH